MDRKRLLAIGLVSLCCLGLAGCGDGDDSDAARLAAIAAANFQEAEARRLGVSAPCAASIQCGALMFLSPVDQCTTLTYSVYSTVSPTAAAASAAALEQVRQAQRARDLYRGVQPVCPFGVPPPPTAVCVASSCEAAK